MRLPSPTDIVIVYWDDIQTDQGWIAPDGELGAARCFTVGVVIAVDKRLVTLSACVGAGTSDQSTEVNLRMAIPTGCITSWAPLRKGKVVKA